MSFLVNGASDGIWLEPYCVEFAKLIIHETEFIEQIYRFLYHFLHLIFAV